MAFAVHEKSSIKTIDDLVGKNICIGAQGGGLGEIAQIVLTEVYGLKDKANIINMAWADSASALRDGTLDAALVYTTGRELTSFTTELDNSADIRLLEWIWTRSLLHESQPSEHDHDHEFASSTMQNSSLTF
jgi:TRAP-type uncharacterized transport system substrate-binding protein